MSDRIAMAQNGLWVCFCIESHGYLAVQCAAEKTMTDIIIMMNGRL